MPVWWELAPPDVAKRVASPYWYEQKYCLIGSPAGSGVQDMCTSRKDKRTWETSFLIGLQCEEEFQLLRDRDRMQVFYPAQSSAGTPSTVLGPDGLSQGKSWVVRGAVGDPVTVRLRVADGRVTVTLRCNSIGEQTWQNWA